MPLRRSLRVVHVAQEANLAGARHDFARKFHLLGRQSGHVNVPPGEGQLWRQAAQEQMTM
jgi:hypothetical protein